MFNNTYLKLQIRKYLSLNYLNLITYLQYILLILFNNKNIYILKNYNPNLLGVFR